MELFYLFKIKSKRIFVAGVFKISDYGVQQGHIGGKELTGKHFSSCVCGSCLLVLHTIGDYVTINLLFRLHGKLFRRKAYY